MNYLNSHCSLKGTFLFNGRSSNKTDGIDIFIKKLSILLQGFRILIEYRVVWAAVFRGSRVSE